MPFSFAVLKKPNPSRLFFAQFISQTCDKMMTVGLVWILTQNYSASMIPWFLGVSALPHLLLSRHSGNWVSRLGVLKTVIWTDVARGFLFVATGLLWTSVPSHAALAALFVLTFVSNVAGALFNPAMFSLPVHLPEREWLQQTTAMVDACFSFGNITGPLLSAIFFPRLGLPGLFIFNGLSFFVGALIEKKIVLAAPEAALSETAEVAPAGESLRSTLGGDRLLGFMLAGFLVINLFLAPVMIFMPLYAKNIYRGEISSLAWLESAMAVGMILGSLSLTVFDFSKKRGKIAVCMVAVAVCDLGFAYSSNLLLGCVWILALGLFLGTTNIFSMSLFQSRPPRAQVPAMMGLVNLISVASLPLSMFVMGALVKLVDIRSLAVCFGFILLTATLGVISNRELRSQ